MLRKIALIVVFLIFGTAGGASSKAPSTQAPLDILKFKPVEIISYTPLIIPVIPTPESTPALTKRTYSTIVSGVPTYYCRAGISRCTKNHPDRGATDLYAAAGPSLRVGNWRGRVVHVCSNNTCIDVTLIDWCACASPHFLDLYYDAFVLLGKPSWATVSW